VFVGELGGTTGIGCKVEAKSESGPGLNPKEFLERSSHSSLHAKGEERGERLLRLWPDCIDEDDEEGDEGEELWEGADEGQITKRG
jgi:hypothetical protein